MSRKTTGTSSTISKDDGKSRLSRSVTVTQFQDDLIARALKRHTARQRSRWPAQDKQVSNPPVSQAGSQDKKRIITPVQPKMCRPTSTTQTSQVTGPLSVNAPPFVPQVLDQIINDSEDEAVRAQDGTRLT